MASFVYVKPHEAPLGTAWKKTAYTTMAAWLRGSGAVRHMVSSAGGIFGIACFKTKTGKLVQPVCMTEAQAEQQNVLEKRMKRYMPIFVDKRQPVEAQRAAMHAMLGDQEQAQRAPRKKASAGLRQAKSKRPTTRRKG